MTTRSDHLALAERTPDCGCIDATLFDAGSATSRCFSARSSPG